MDLRITTYLCDNCQKKLISPFVSNNGNTFCNNICLENFSNPNTKFSISDNSKLDLLAKEITKTLHNEKIDLSATISVDKKSVFITLFGAETKFAKFKMKQSIYSKDDWRCYDDKENSLLPVHNTTFLTEHLRYVFETLFDEWEVRL